MRRKETVRPEKAAGSAGSAVSPGSVRAGIGFLTAVFLVFFAAALLFLVNWVFQTWRGLTAEEILFHMQAPLTGTGGGMIEKGLFHTLVPAFAVLAADIFLCVKLRGNQRFSKFLKWQRIASILIIAITFVFSWNRLALGSWISNQMNVSSFIEDNYSDPAQVQITFPEKKRNLIYIYLESMETTYSGQESGGAFEKDIIPELTKLARENEDFSGNSGVLDGGAVLPSGTYTMAALFSQSTGLPMKVDIGEDFTDKRGSFNSMDTQKSFFPGATTLGDILEQEGYKQVFLLGSDASFGGRRLFYQSHGNFEIHDYNWAIQQKLIPEDYYVFWGYEDEKLFANAKEELLELSRQDEPFNLTMLTVDTHFEDGYKCRLCKDDFGRDNYANALACSSRQVAQFIEWVQKQDFYENTTIVLAGDHLTMDSDFCETVPDSYERKTYTVYINADAQPADPDRVRNYSTLDAFPTTLAALGCTIEGDRLGMGTNLFSERDTMLEEQGYASLADEIKKRSPFVESLAQIDKYDTALMKRKGLLPKSTILIHTVNTEKKRMGVQVLNIKNVYQDIKKVTLLLEDGSGKQLSTDCHKGKYKGSYLASVDISKMDYRYASLTAFAVFADGSQCKLSSVTGDLSLKIRDINSYLGTLAENPQYCILAAVKDDGSRLFSKVMEKGMAELGFKKSLYRRFRYSYYGVTGPDGLIAEDRGRESLSCEGTLPDGVSYSIVSQGGNSGAGGSSGRYLTCAIKIGGVQYAVQRVGINFVIYDSVNHRVVDSVCFNTNKNLACRRKDLTEDYQEKIRADSEKEPEVKPGRDQG